MCGINGIYLNNSKDNRELSHHLQVMNTLIKHRGPDGQGIWLSKDISHDSSNARTTSTLGLGHVRLSIIDLSTAANQPFVDALGNCLVFNGEIYNYIELRQKLKNHWQFTTQSDTEVILAAYQHYGSGFLNYLEGMFAFALWDNRQKKLILVRDRIGIKSLYYYTRESGDSLDLYFSSEPKALLPFVDNLQVNPEGLTEYLMFQYPLQEDLIFARIKQLLPAQQLVVHNNKITSSIYWQLNYSNYYTNPKLARSEFVELMHNVVQKHVRSDVPLGSYLSGGVDSSLVTLLSKKQINQFKLAINGRFAEDTTFNESNYAKKAAAESGVDLKIVDISVDDFIANINNIIYHLDYPSAGPGSFPQYMVSKEAGRHVKVMLGGQGGDELFGGYARYTLIYLDQVIKHAMDGDLNNPCLLPDPTRLLSQLSILSQYKPLYKQFMSKDCFSAYSKRYYDLINKADDFTQEEIDWHSLPVANIYSKFENIFNSTQQEQDYLLNKVQYFDFKCLLPALLHVEDRVSMAHGIESRVPLLDHRVAEFAAGLSPNIKFADGEMKGFLKSCYGKLLPQEILNRKDKMGFPVPINQWAQSSKEFKNFIMDTFSTINAKNRDYINYNFLLNNLSLNKGFSRKLWGMLSLELWYQNYIDKQEYYRTLASKNYEDINIM